MSLYRRAGTGYWWCRFTLGGREVRCTTGTADRALAEEFEHELRKRHWRELRLGESQHTFGQAGERWLRERATKRSIGRDRQILAEYVEFKDLPLRLFTWDMLSEIREAREKAEVRDGKPITLSAVNRELALIRSILNAAAGSWRWLEHAPKVPMKRVEAVDPRFITRQQFYALVKLLPPHAAAMARFAVSTGLRRANITGLTWDRVDLKRATAFIPGSQAKGKRGIAVPLNADALRVLRKQKGHPTHVFTFRGEPVEQLMTRAWRRACVSAGLAGLRFHDLRHTWASWQAQAGTPLYAIREMGGWASDSMVRRYSHLTPGHLAEYASNTLLRRTRVGTGRKAARGK